MEIKIGCGSGCCFLLFLVFLVLKLCNVISWSWWWVFAPILIPIYVTLFIGVLIVILWLIVKNAEDIN